MENNPYEAPSLTTDIVKPASKTFASCPACGNSNAEKVGSTLWGGAIGPWLLSHVKCNDCGTKYNGKSGKSNLVPIIVYSVVMAVVSYVVVLVIFEALTKN